jgi:tetratricopeptide (TPR) repeat protein
VYLERQVENSDEVVMQPDFGIVEENLFNGLFDKYDLSSLGDKEITLTKSLENNILTIVVSPLASNTEKKTSVPLYDYVGNVVATISLTQEAGTVEIPAGSVPKLGKDGEMAVASFAHSLLRGMQSYSFVEQAYWSNQETGWASRITSGDTDINKAWSNLYKANSQLLNLREIDERYLNVYGDFCSVLSAISYSTLLYGWGGVPYVVEYSQYENAMSGIPRTSEKEILIDLQKRLLVAIENIEEKKNESLGDINGLFFVSKDVARVLLANLYMYERRYSEAAPLLNQVINNGFYSLDASTDFKTSPELDVEYTRVSVEESTEVIFALSDQGATTRVVIQYPGVMPYITLSDVYLSLAECLYHTGNEGQAEDLLEALVRAKSLMLIEKDTLLRIKEVRERLSLYSGTYFAFLKRNNLAKDVCGIEDYRLLFPIPNSEMMNNMMMTQNPGY